ncbi:hypothetical protein HJD18_14630 [Thermoleophilia bacterium SCSIO 60948]|nr:hypothetical protein HJD18_14630 [Thermoleophilia bacterium SCSIO 60948]
MSRVPRARRLAVLGLLAIVLAGVVAVVAIGGDAGQASAPAGPRSTLDATFRDPDGDGKLETAAGEPFAERTELAPASEPGKTLAELGQVTDAHVRDEESPARAVQLDRLGDPVTEAFRPQEALSPQVFAAALGALDAAAPDAVLISGDLIDSAQRNELDLALGILEGGEVDPDSGGPGYDGPQEASSPDPFVFRPDVDAPTAPGVLDRAQESFISPGLDVPWLPAVGNHDLLVQGEAPPEPLFEDIAVGDERLVEIDQGLELPDSPTRELLADVLEDGLPGTTTPTPADPDRRYLEPAELVGDLREASGVGGAGERLDYGFDAGEDVRIVVLDVADRAGGAGGAVTDAELELLDSELDAAAESGRWVFVASHQPLDESDRGDEALALIDRSPQVVAVLSGHTHENLIEPRESSAGGYWAIETSSLADFPEQSRMLRLRETADGLVIETWMLDHTDAGLPGVSRELGYIDAQGGRPRGLAGGAEDRNARLYLER